MYFLYHGVLKFLTFKKVFLNENNDTTSHSYENLLKYSRQVTSLKFQRAVRVIVTSNWFEIVPDNANMI